MAIFTMTIKHSKKCLIRHFSKLRNYKILVLVFFVRSIRIVSTLTYKCEFDAKITEVMSIRLRGSFYSQFDFLWR